MPGSPCQALQQFALHGHRGLYSLKVTNRSNVYTVCTIVHEHCIAKAQMCSKHHNKVRLCLFNLMSLADFNYATDLQGLSSSQHGTCHQ
jgi:hypothetical protein